MNLMLYALKKTPEKVKDPEPEKPKEPEAKKPKFVVKPPRTTEKEVEKTVEKPTGEVVPEKETLEETQAAATTKQEKAQGPETYVEEQRGKSPHVPVWSLKQKDTFVEFGVRRDWFLGTFHPGEVSRQRALNHEGLYHVYIVEQAKARSANHQILKNKFAEEKASFEAEKKAKEWGREGLKNKLQAAEELLANERAEWKKVCQNDNKRMYVARSKITNLEGEVATLKGKVEEAQADKECVEVQQASSLSSYITCQDFSNFFFHSLKVELNAQIVNSDKDLAAKNVEIAELKRRLFEAHEKSESLEIDLEAERVRADTAEEAKNAALEARNISTSTLNVAQNNYAKAQSIVDTLVFYADRCPACCRASRCYVECAWHVEEALGQHFGTRHCSVTDQANAILSRAEEVYDHLSLPVMELVRKALKHDDYVARLKSILEHPETVELLDEEEEEVGGEGDGGNE
ncbi:hypothetical protein Hanom_Chr14g01294941 [Helianthus anomalus]